MATQYQFTNNATTTLASGITNVATSVTLATGTGALFPALSGGSFFYATLQTAAGTTSEIIKVTARSTDTLTIVRAQEGTTASAFSTGDKCELRLTAGEINQIFSGTVQGAGTDQVFLETSRTVTGSYTLTTSKNAMSVGPVTLNAGVIVTIPSGAKWVIL